MKVVVTYKETRKMAVTEATNVKEGWMMVNKIAL